ncbi:MAG: GHMP kinase, partial [Jatrophihabitantaceae bacterium]
MQAGGLTLPSLQLPRADTARPLPESELVGLGFAPAHHGELLQGIFLDETGTPRRALVTLPEPGRGTRAVFRPSYRHGGVLGPPELIKVRRAAMLTLGQLPSYRSPAKGGQIEITSDVPRGIGMGSSTSDVTATIRAVADCHGIELSKEEVARLAVLAECASDSVMIDDRVVLFAHREGVVLETFGPQLPPMIVLGCDAQPDAQVDTLRLPPADYDQDEVAAFGVLRAAIRR